MKAGQQNMSLTAVLQVVNTWETNIMLNNFICQRGDIILSLFVTLSSLLLLCQKFEK